MEVEQRGGVFVLVGYVDALGVIGVDRQPGLDLGRAEAALGGVGPLHGGAALVAGGVGGVLHGLGWTHPVDVHVGIIHPVGDYVADVLYLFQHQVSHADFIAVIDERRAAQGEHGGGMHSRLGLSLGGIEAGDVVARVVVAEGVAGPAVDLCQLPQALDLVFVHRDG